MMSKIGVVIVDGVGFRNFALSNFFDELLEENKKIVIFSGLKKEVYKDKKFDSIEIIELDVYKESKVSWVFRKTKEVAHLQKNKSSIAIKNNLNNRRPKSYGLKANLTRLIILFTLIFHSEKWIEFYFYLQRLSFRNNDCYKKYFKVLEKSNCDLLFFTHQRPSYLALLFDAAKKQQIRTVSFIFSWDNITSKGRMAADFDGFLVWSQLMKDELKSFYPTLNSNKIYVVGTPQFEPYVLDKYFMDKATFLKVFNINPNKKILYYSCGDVSTSKLDPLYIETIALAIKNKKIEDVNFIVRTSPAEDNTRFQKIIKEYPNIIWNFPDWKLTRENHTETWSQRVPTRKDIIDLRAILSFSDININMCSTMSLDIMLFDKPVINAVFGNKENGLYNDQKYLNYSHYAKVVKSKAVTIAKNKEELLVQINEALTKPNLRKESRKNLINLEIGKPLEGTSKRIVEVLKSF